MTGATSGAGTAYSSAVFEFQICHEQLVFANIAYLSHSDFL
jgi:hypothetical protein